MEQGQSSLSMETKFIPSAAAVSSQTKPTSCRVVTAIDWL